MDIPGTLEPDFFGIHPGAQANQHMSIAVDPQSPNIVYVGGDRQPSALNDTDNFSTSANSIGAGNFTGRLFRGDASQPTGLQWTPLTHNFTAGGSAPHADSRDMVFAADGALLEGDDGGVYVRTFPQSFTGDWFSLNGNLGVTEIHSLSYDSLNQITFGGHQDVGSSQQSAPGSSAWTTINQGDGGETAVDLSSSPGQAIRYSSSQNFGGFRQEVFSSSNQLLSREFPALTLLAGDPLDGQFLTPIALSNGDADAARGGRRQWRL